MANIDESASLSSDEKLDFKCNPCEEGDVVKGATFFCPDCAEYYCDSCELSHRRLKATKTHKVLHEAELYTSSPRKRTTLPMMVCNCSQSGQVEFVCNEHSDVFCVECKNINHRKCKTFSIEEKSKSITEASLNSTSERVKASKSKTAYLRDKQKTIICEFTKMVGECKEEIETIQKKLHAFVDEIADASLKDIEASNCTHSSTLNTLLTTATGITQRLTNDEKRLHDAILSGEGSQMFVANTIASKNCDTFDIVLEDIEKDIDDVVISFHEDNTIANLPVNVKTFGTITVQKKRNIPLSSVPKVLLSMVAVEDEQCSFSPLGAQRITGSTFMPNGDLLICDTFAKTVKLFGPSFKESYNLQLSGQPWDVFSVTTTSAILSMINDMKLQFIETRPSLKEKTAIILDRKCFGIAVADEKIFVSCSDDPGRGEIRIFDISGKLERKLGIYSDGTRVLDLPTYIRHVINNGKVYTSEYNKGDIYCLTKDGNVQFKYHISGTNLRGMIVDKEENIYVCDEAKNCIYAVTEGGTKHETFLKLPSTAASPTSMAYRASDDTLIVTCYKKVLVYRLKQK